MRPSALAVEKAQRKAGCISEKCLIFEKDVEFVFILFFLAVFPHCVTWNCIPYCSGPQACITLISYSSFHIYLKKKKKTLALPLLTVFPYFLTSDLSFD